jgi:4,5-DOPA dioxygenase extradiol
MMNAKLNDHHLPTLFVPHGSPMSVLRPGAAGAALAAAAASLPPLRVIVVVSAHWDTLNPTVGYADRPETIYDFWGFPDELYSIRYPATGCREAADEVRACLQAGGLSPEVDGSRGLDHGAWIPLRMMFPDADVPVIPLSIQSHLGPQHHLSVGRALAPLAARGILVLASGNLTHNLHDLQVAYRAGGTSPGYVREFADWIGDKLVARDLPALLDYRARAPHAQRAHPTEDHLLPLYVAVGAAGEDFETNRIHAGVDDFVLAMDAFSFRTKEQP